MCTISNLVMGIRCHGTIPVFVQGQKNSWKMFPNCMSYTSVHLGLVCMPTSSPNSWIQMANTSRTEFYLEMNASTKTPKWPI